MDVAIRTRDLGKAYRGGAVGVSGLNLEVRRGEIFGYLGPNGAGKTTTIRLMLDLIRPSAGQIEIFGLDSRRDSLAIRRRLGYLPGELSLYEHLTVQELLSHFGHLRGEFDLSHVTEMAERLDLDLRPTIRSLSKGNKQKVGLVQAMMNRPDLLILDEPTGGLDPLVQQVVHQLLFEVRAEGKTVFLSSHVLSEVERVADRVGIIGGGHLVAVQNVASLKAAAVRRVSVRFAGPVPQDVLSDVPGVEQVKVEGDEAHMSIGSGSIDLLVKTLARFEVVDLIAHEPDLEEIFLAFYGNHGDRDVA